MTKRTEVALSEMERRLNAIRMGGSERLVATAAMRHSFIIVERFTSLAQALAQIAAHLFPKPRLARWLRNFRSSAAPRALPSARDSA